MDFVELLRILWSRKLALVVAMLVSTGVGIAFLSLAEPRYEATSTLTLAPGTADELVFLGQVNTLVPIYADAASSPTTRAAAERRLGRTLGEVYIDTFPETSIFRIRARDTNAEFAQQAAQAVTQALLARERVGDIGISGLELEQMDRPALPQEPVYPRRQLTLGVALLVGLFLGMGLAFAREALVSKVETVDDLARAAGAPALAEIPHERTVEAVRNVEDFLTDSRLRLVTESFHDLRTALLYSDGSARSVVVTSPEGHHGKTTVAVGLAATMARLGRRTLLIDGDLRRGRIADMLGLPDGPGLSEALTGQKVPVHSTSLPALEILGRGRALEDPGELIGLIERNFHLLLNELGRRYETIVIDAPPMAPINDARIMASFASATILVATAGLLNRAAVRVATERLATIGAHPTGVVLNKSQRRRQAGYYDYLVPPKKRRSRGERRRRRRERGSGVSSSA